MKRKLAAILCADVVGYSRLMAEDEEEALHRLLASREVFDSIVHDVGGRIFNTAGDAILAEFSSAVEAVRAAIDIQESLRTRNLAFPPSRQMLFRIGITIGDVVEQEGDLLGDAVNIAARLETLAEPGGICLSQVVREQVSNKLTARFRDIGLQSVKNIPQDIHAVIVEMGDGGHADAARPGTMRIAKIAALALSVVFVVATVLYYQFQYNIKAPPPDKPVTISAAPAQPGVVEKPTLVAKKDTPATALTPANPVEATALLPKTSPAPTRPIGQTKLSKAAPNTAPAENMLQIAPNSKTRQELEAKVRQELEAKARQELEAKARQELEAKVRQEQEAKVRQEQEAKVRQELKNKQKLEAKAKPSTPVLMRGRRFRLAEVPFLRNVSREIIGKKFAHAEQHRALAINHQGDNGFSWGKKTVDEAERESLELCEKRNNNNCEVFAIDDLVVWDHPAPQLPPRPWVRADAVVLPFDEGRLTMLKRNARTEIRNSYASSDSLKAIAVGQNGSWAYVIRGASDEESMSRALQICAFHAGGVCRIIAKNDVLIADSFVPALTVPATPDAAAAVTEEISVSRSMLGEPFQTQKVPFVCDACRRGVVRRFARGKRHRAIAINDFGNTGIARGFKSKKGARRRALQRCKSKINSKCEIYAVNNMVVWDHPEPQLPPEPWVQTGALMVPFNVNELSSLSENSRAKLHKKYPAASPPKALAISPDGHWAYKSKMTSREEAMRMALQICAFSAGEACKIIAVDDSLVVK